MRIIQVPRLHLALAVVFLVVGSARIVSTYRVFNHTIDEPAHLGAGLEWIDGHQYTAEDLHPPLARVFGALGPHWAGVRWSGDTNVWYEGFRQLGHGEHYDRTLALGRLGILPFFWLAGTVVFLWALRIGGALAATLSVFLFTTVPPVLSHAGLMTTDMALTACLGAAALASLYWAERPSLVRSIVFGFFLSLAVLAKFSSLVFLPAAWVLMYALSFWERPRGWSEALAEMRRSVGMAGVVLTTMAVFVWAGYLFTYGRVEHLNMCLPAPTFFTGLRSMWLRNQETGIAYLLGQRSLQGFWYYFPVVLAVKTPLALLLLTGLAGWLASRLRARMRTLMPLALSLGIVAVSMLSRINIGSRHVLPVYVGVCVAGGIAGAHVLASRGVKRRLVVMGLLGWQLVSGLHYHPDYLAYANELAGGHPENVLADSDLDWGQDMKRLGARLQTLGAHEVTMNIFNRGYLLAGHPFPKVKDMPDGNQPLPGWNAISLTAWKLSSSPEWAARIPPHEIIGRSIYLYHFPPHPPTALEKSQ